MAGTSHDLCVCFDKTLIWFDGGESDNLVFSDLPLANNVDHSGIAICSPRHSGFARVRIDLVETFPAIEDGEWDFVGECLLHTFDNLRPSTIGLCEHTILDTNTRKAVQAEIPTPMGIYRVRVFIANYHATQQRMDDLLMYGRKPGETEFKMPTVDELMQMDNYHLLVTRIKDVSVIYP